MFLGSPAQQPLSYHIKKAGLSWIPGVIHVQHVFFVAGRGWFRSSVKLVSVSRLPWVLRNAVRVRLLERIAITPVQQTFSVGSGEHYPTQ